ncbi:MAG: Fe-Mn family superoxide dismutase [Candidatus Paceibacterota bacterium]|jgi:Fe-Mn family superoxide dismutase
MKPKQPLSTKLSETTGLPKELQNLLDTEVKKTVREALSSQGLMTEKKKSPAPVMKVIQTVVAVSKKLQEAFTVIPRSFLMKTERLSDRTKQAHEVLYKEYVEAYNKLSVGLSAANTEEAKSSTSAYRSLKVDEVYNLNAIKLHELYFSNISDMASEIGVDSIPYMRLARDFGTFEKWQFDFMACAMSSRNGWAMTVYEPYRNVYMNVFVDGHTQGVPVGSIPVIVLDMFEHAYYKDYANDKKAYIVGMMRELNWNVIEARSTVAERANLINLYMIMPIVNGMPEAMLHAAENGQQPPIENIVPAPGSITQQPPLGGPGPVAATAPPSPATQAPTPGTQQRRW